MPSAFFAVNWGGRGEREVSTPIFRGYGDYAAEREALLSRKSLNELLRESKQRRGLTVDAP
jgi:hypothetical protein